jgi:hypothetical protein
MMGKIVSITFEQWNKCFSKGNFRSKCVSSAKIGVMALIMLEDFG